MLVAQFWPDVVPWPRGVVTDLFNRVPASLWVLDGPRGLVAVSPSDWVVWAGDEVAVIPDVVWRLLHA